MPVKRFAPRHKVVRQAPGPLLDKALHLFTTFLYPVKYYLDESKMPSEQPLDDVGTTPRCLPFQQNIHDWLKETT